jgi:hypothetical protein
MHLYHKYQRVCAAIKRAKKGEFVDLKHLLEPHDYGKNLSDNATYYDEDGDGRLDPQKSEKKKKASRHNQRLAQLRAARYQIINEVGAHEYGPDLNDFDIYYDADADGVMDQPFEADSEGDDDLEAFENDIPFDEEVIDLDDDLYEVGPVFSRKANHRNRIVAKHLRKGR